MSCRSEVRYGFDQLILTLLANEYGQLGRSYRSSILHDLPCIVQASAGYFHSAVILENGTVLTWGLNEGDR